MHCTWDNRIEATEFRTPATKGLRDAAAISWKDDGLDVGGRYFTVRYGEFELNNVDYIACL